MTLVLFDGFSHGDVRAEGGMRVSRDSKRPERWALKEGDHNHTVEITDLGWRRQVAWLRDGDEVVTRRSDDKRIVLNGGPHGSVRVNLPQFIGPARRVSLFQNAKSAYTGLGGTDFAPEAGSRAAEREAWIRAHPRQYAIRRTAAAAAGVLIPILLAALLMRIPWPGLPNLPRPDIPWPDWRLPQIPWPDIPWPDWRLPDWDMPEWVGTLLDRLKYVWPVLLAVFWSWREVRRRREQDRRKAEASTSGRQARGESGDPVGTKKQLQDDT